MKRCEECGNPMEDTQGGQYCCKGCEQKAWRRKHTFTCKTCGKEFVADTGVFGPKAHGYCSEECQRNGLLKQIKPKADKMLKALKRDVEKRQASIDKIVAAVRSDDPDAIIKAIKGSFFKRFCRCLWWVLKAIPFYIGLVCMVYCAVRFYNEMRPSLERNEKPAAIADELPPLEDSLGTIKTNAVSSGVVTAPVEGAATSTNE